MKKSYYETKFVEVFLAYMWLEGQRKIPFDDRDFSAGVDAIKKYLQEKDVSALGKLNLDLLFQKQTTYGEYNRLMNVIQDMNGVLISLQNPHYLSATINMNGEFAKYLTESNETGIPEADFNNIIKVFCEGASLPFTEKINGAA